MEQEKREMALAKTTLLGTSISLLLIPSLSAQTTVTTYQYDALGRLEHSQAGNGVKSDYTLDSADNRSRVVIQRQLDTNSSGETWQATSLPHAVGYADGYGWAANSGSSNGAMVYGPYTNGVSSGNHVAVWRIMIDNNSNSSGETVAVLDVNDSEANQVIASRNLSYSSFAAPMAYQIFELPFVVSPSQASHHFEFRVWYYSKAYINVDKVARY